MFGYRGFDSKNRDPFKGVFERAVDGGLRVTIRVRDFRRILKKGSVAWGPQQLNRVLGNQALLVRIVLLGSV